MVSSAMNRHPVRRGLTLMELVVVMTILIALAAIIVPLMPGLLARAERSSRATNSQEIYKAVQLFEGLYSHFPTDWDAMCDGSATKLVWLDGSDGIHSDIGFGGATPPLTITALTAPQSAALNAAGINRVQLLSTAAPSGNNGQDVTFNPYLDVNDRGSATGSMPITNSSTPNLVTLSSKGQFILNLSDNAATSSGTYVVLGLGKRCSLVGSGVNEAPTNFFDSASKSPNERYSRYGVIFQVSGVSLTNTAAGATNPIIDFARARLVRVIRFSTTPGTGDDAIRDYWRVVAAGDGA